VWYTVNLDKQIYCKTMAKKRLLRSEDFWGRVLVCGIIRGKVWYHSVVPSIYI
jgi:hypothetical protein